MSKEKVPRAFYYTIFAFVSAFFLIFYNLKKEHYLKLRATEAVSTILLEQYSKEIGINDYGLKRLFFENPLFIRDFNDFYNYLANLYILSKNNNLDFDPFDISAYDLSNLTDDERKFFEDFFAFAKSVRDYRERNNLPLTISFNPEQRMRSIFEDLKRKEKISSLSYRDFKYFLEKEHSYYDTNFRILNNRANNTLRNFLSKPGAVIKTGNSAFRTKGRAHRKRQDRIRRNTGITPNTRPRGPRGRRR